jgi:hypothetical protein
MYIRLEQGQTDFAQRSVDILYTQLAPAGQIPKHAL